MDKNRRKYLIAWLFSLCLLTALMVVVGGITRLTHSGLSMVEWKPLLGALPPLSEKAWQEVFQKYSIYPEYKIINKGMTLQEFKFIFLWEYGHRLLGRTIGVVFLIPFLVFALKRYFTRTLITRLLIGFALGGLQGLMGWYMVKSGLVNVPRVSHYRLAAHLLLAFLIIGYLLWLIFDLIHEDRKGKFSFNRACGFSLLFIFLLTVQIFYGALVAGKKAGFGYNTFPTMGTGWIPEGMFTLAPWWLNLFDNNTTLQFIHRGMAWLLCGLVLYFCFAVRRSGLNRSQRKAAYFFLAAFVIQFVLGVFTLIYVVPIPLAAAHQGGAVFLFGASLYTVYAFGRLNGQSSDLHHNPSGS